MKLDVNQFENSTRDEYLSNLKRLKCDSHESIVGSWVYYSKKVYGKHKIIKWDPNRAEFLLDLEGQKFWSNPFIITLCTD